jgi:type IV secretion system protein VirD4
MRSTIAARDGCHSLERAMIVRGLRSIAEKVWWGFQALAELENRRRARDEELRKHQADALSQAVQAAYIRNPVASGRLGDARLGTRQDARAAGLINKGAGLPLGFLGGLALSYIGDSHIVTYARTGGGKFRDHLATVLATVTDQSFVVICPKDGSTTYATLTHRAEVLGQNILVLNPWGMLGLPSPGLNVLDELKSEKAKKRLVQTARQKASMLVPIIEGAGKETWPKEGAQDLLTIVIAYLAHATPDRCNLPQIYVLVVRDEESIVKYLTDTIGKSDAPSGIPGQAVALARTIQRAGSQWSAIKQELNRALLFVAPGEPYAEAMARTEIDISVLKRTPTTLYILVPGGELETASSYLQLTIDYILESLANAEGNVRTTVLLDEFQQIATLSRLPKSLNLYRARGVRLWFFIHNRAHLGTKYSPEFVSAIDSACEVMTAWDLEDDEFIKRIEYLSGKTTVATPGLNAGASAVGSAGWSVSEHARPLLQAHDLRLMGPKKMLLRVYGHPYFIADRIPYYEIAETANCLRDPREVTPTSVLPVPSCLQTTASPAPANRPSTIGE